jgi:hypothetical protein
MMKVVERERNKFYYLILHIPLWIWAFWIIPGQLTSDLFRHGPDRRHWIWLGVVSAVCLWRGIAGRLPGSEAIPYITHFGEDKPNPMYRVVCYTVAWIDLLAPFAINLTALVVVAVTGKWIIYSLYGAFYYSVVAIVIMVTMLDLTPRARRSVREDGAEKACFYLAVWVVAPTQVAAWTMWRMGKYMGLSGAGLNLTRLATFLVVAGVFTILGFLEKLPRTRRYAAAEHPAPEMLVSATAEQV